jgi:hypothetical protein
MKEILNERYGDEDDEDALIHHRRMTKRGYSSAAATKVTGYTPPAKAYTPYQKQYPNPHRAATPAAPTPNANPNRQYMNVSFGDKDVAKAAAIAIQKRLLWDPEHINPVTNRKGCWFVDSSAGAVDHESLRKWLIK